jgi:chemotaxis protein CheD
MSTPLRHRGRAYFADEALAEVPVRIGDVKVAAGESLLYCIGLGSCVAVALYDADARIGGIAHAMLPTPDRGRGDSPHGRFVSAAVPELIGLLQDAGASADRLRARLAGGASMFPDLLDREGLHLGRRNVEVAREALLAAGIPIDGEDVLGTHGRSVFLRTTDGKLLVTSVVHDAISL